MYALNKTLFPYFHWVQAAPSGYRDKSHCVVVVEIVALAAAAAAVFRH